MLRYDDQPDYTGFQSPVLFPVLINGVIILLIPYRRTDVFFVFLLLFSIKLCLPVLPFRFFNSSIRKFLHSSYKGLNLRIILT
uniref:Uncharacterized protein n=1 Tax=Rhizophagus irregularis (strain DAOM 181602 / DAOM 197198 / MUCL 43194) TaxID=747089 RepID=U9TAL9_RHIID